MRNDATIDTRPLAGPRMPVQQALEPVAASISVIAMEDVFDGSDAPGNRSTFETVSLQSNRAPVSFGTNAAWTRFAITCFTAKVHPRGATGVAQCVESIQPLPGAWIALAHNMGGPTAALAAMILEGPGNDGG